MELLMKVKINRPDIPEGHRLLTREEKFAFAKKYGMSITQANKLLRNATVANVYETFTEGSKVKLNYEKIISQKNDKTENYLMFVENNKDKIFTIEYDENHQDNPSVFCLKEDTTSPKWLFNINNLILVEMADPT